MIGRSSHMNLSWWVEFKLQFQVQFVLNIYPVQSVSFRHLVNFLPPSKKDLLRYFQNDLHLYPLLQRIWFQHTVVLHASSIYKPWWVRLLLDLKNVFKNEKFSNLFETRLWGKIFKLNSKWNKQKNDHLLTIGFLLHANIGEARSRVFYVTHALPFKIWTNSLFMIFDHMLIEKLHVAWWFHWSDSEIKTSFSFSSPTTEFLSINCWLVLNAVWFAPALENSSNIYQKTFVWDVSKKSESEELSHPTCICHIPMNYLLLKTLLCNFKFY